MGKINFCEKCGSGGLKQNGTRYVCPSCNHVFSDVSDMGGSPALSYVGALFGNPTPPPVSGGTFSAPPQSLLDTIQANAERQRRQEDAIRAEREASSRRSGSGRTGGGNGHGAVTSGGNASSSSGSSGNASGNSSNSSSGSGSSNNSNGRTGNGSGNNSSNGAGGNSGGNGSSGASDSENTLRFLDNVNRMNDTAYDLVNGNASVWANIARDKGIIDSKQQTEIKYMVATRNCIAHGSGDSVRITPDLVTNAKNYYELMRRTASQIK